MSIVNEVVLSLFPGIGILDKAFEEEGFCVVRGPDLLWGGDIKRFHAPVGRFDGVIGGSPCQAFSRLIHIVRHNGYTEFERNLIPEFERVVLEAHPARVEFVHLDILVDGAYRFSTVGGKLLIGLAPSAHVKVMLYR